MGKWEMERDRKDRSAAFLSITAVSLSLFLYVFTSLPLHCDHKPTFNP